MLLACQTNALWHFFRIAMGTANHTTIRRNENGKCQYLHEAGNAKLVDELHYGQDSQFVSGRTTITWEDKLVWVMCYTGFCLDEADSFHIQCLLRGNQSLEFHGCRGLSGLRDDVLKYTYINIPQGQEYTFADFAGRETIITDTGQIVCEFNYHGRLMFKLQ